MNIGLVRGEFIGLQVRIRQKKDGREVQGKVIDETKGMITLLTGDMRRIRFIKTGIMLMIGHHEIDGSIINERPEDRIRIRLLD
ncbi:ribonuclease P protein subunit [Candidatus Woesearchaeota archaeon]|nr:ribonuclease P protein subunit [Candidatus Woesearchaeota archaeon]